MLERSLPQPAHARVGFSGRYSRCKRTLHCDIGSWHANVAETLRWAEAETSSAQFSGTDNELRWETHSNAEHAFCDPAHAGDSAYQCRGNHLNLFGGDVHCGCLGSGGGILHFQFHTLYQSIITSITECVMQIFRAPRDRTNVFFAVFYAYHSSSNTPFFGIERCRC